MVVEGAEGQRSEQQQVGQRQVEEQHRAAPPRLHVKAQDPQSGAVAHHAQDELCAQQRRLHPAQNGAGEVALHLGRLPGVFALLLLLLLLLQMIMMIMMRLQTRNKVTALSVNTL